MFNNDRDEELADQSPESSQTSSGNARWYHYVGDFFNTVKAFIGTNYLALPFAFQLSGLAFGIAGVLIIASLTDYCCHLLVECKYIVIDDIIEKESGRRPMGPREISQLRSKLAMSVSYGDIGNYVFGRWCRILIDVAVAFTQYLTVVCYFVFLGSSIFTLYPIEPAAIPLNDSKPVPHSHLLDDPNPISLLRNIIPVLDSYKAQQCPIDDQSTVVKRDVLPQYVEANYDTDEATTYFMFDGDFSNSTNITLAPIHQLSTEEVTTETGINVTMADIVTAAHTNWTTVAPNTTTTTANWTTIMPVTTTSSPPPTTPEVTTPLPTRKMYYKSLAPPLEYLVMFPLGFFILTSLIRNMRYLSPLTTIATLCLVGGAVSVFLFLILGLEISDNVEYYKWMSLPLFVGQLISSYEGIGCILPIESSMEGNRHAFPGFLHGAVFFVWVVLTSFGTIGYLRYGDSVQQLIILSIPEDSILAKCVIITLIISVLFTYPLQCYPVIMLLEGFIFGSGIFCSTKSPNLEDSGEHSVINASDGQSLLTESAEQQDEGAVHEVAIIIPEGTPWWQRNVLRVLLTLSVMGVAIWLRDSYAYISAFSGALGCSLLAYILPCLLHFQLKRYSMSTAGIIFDLFIIFLAVIASIMTLVVLALQIAAPHHHN